MLKIGDDSIFASGYSMMSIARELDQKQHKKELNKKQG